MRYDSVIIKANAYGLTLFLDPNIPFSKLIADTGKKFSQAAHFFRNAQMALTFRGRDLTEEEELTLVETITENAHLEIVCLVDESKEHAQKYKEACIRTLRDKKEGAAQIYRGSLENGQTLESDRTVIIEGDVNPGSKVVSNGSVIVLGTLMGQANAGEGGDTFSYVAALTFLPGRLQIGPVGARSAITKRTNTGDYPVDPKIAFLSGGHLAIEKWNGRIYEYLSRTAGTEEDAETKLPVNSGPDIRSEISPDRKTAASTGSGEES